MRNIGAIAIVLLMTLPTQCATVGFVVPNVVSDTIQGNTASQMPFNTAFGSVRYQQVFDASQFSQVPTGGAYLTRIIIRRDCSSIRSELITNVQIRFSTTLKRPDQLSSVFSDNVGLDETLVFGPTNYIPPAGSVQCPGVETFFHGQEPSMHTPFFYNPSNGNLLIEIRHTGMRKDPLSPSDYKLDAHDMTNDSISSLYAHSNTTLTGAVSSVGIVMRFSFDTLPALAASYQTNTLTIAIPFYPQDFRLQSSPTIGSNAVWADYNVQTEQIGFFKYARIPAASLPPKIYFRLIETRVPAPP